VKLFHHGPFLVAAAIILTATGAAARAQEPITRIGEVRSLPREDADKGLPVRVRGVVTWRGFRDQMTVQDGSGGSWLLVGDARRRGLWGTDEAVLKSIRVGHVLEIDGLTDPGAYAPGILPRTLRIVGEEALPPARPIDPARFFSGAEAGLRVEARGVVQGYQAAENGWTLHLDSNPGRFTVEFPLSALPDPEPLVDAEVRVIGVAVTRVNTRGEITMPRIYSSQPGELVVERAATAPFDSPSMPLDRLLPFRAEPVGPHRLRVTGTVTYSLPGRFIYLQEGKGAVRVETHATEVFKIGDRVEAAGFVDMGRSIGTLTGARVRKLSAGTAPPAVTITPEAIIELNNTALDAGHMSDPHDFDGHLVRFRANLAAMQAATDGRQPWRRLLLERGGAIFSAILLDGDPQALDALLPGSELEVTGIVQLEYTPVDEPRVSLRPNRLDVILRSAGDVRVVRSPSWWTPRRLLAAMAAVVVAFGAALVWAAQLRRQVRRKTEQLAGEMQARRNAAIEFHATLRERNRLAANLHDTLLQTLGGIGFQIGAGEAEAALPDRAGKPIAQLAVARRILDHAVQELRSSVWALRSPPLQGKSFPEALQAVVEREGTGRTARIEVHTEGDFGHVSDFVAGNLVLAAQEALRNALKHASPRVITIEANTTEKTGWITVVIRDDGVGFTPGQEAGAHQGHFGLVGMRERIERLEGSLHMDSAPGRGTTVRLEVPLRSYDETVA
jgi:signal transduction histidine kinase